MTYPESHIEEIRAALRKEDDNSHLEAADAALFLLAAFLVDVRRIADALVKMENTQYLKSRD